MIKTISLKFMRSQWSDARVYHGFSEIRFFPIVFGYNQEAVSLIFFLGQNARIMSLILVIR